MELTKQSISNHSRLIPGIEGYLTLIDKIEENKSIHPDIAIETCKSLLEGLCLKGLSLLSDKYINSKSLRTKCKNDLKALTNTAFDEVYTDYVESQVHESLANMLIDISVTQKIKDNAKRKVRDQAIEAIAKVSAIRNERGDISHGRVYPKRQESSIALSKSICSITDGICSFMIEQIAEKYLLKLKTQDRLIYQDLTDFNNWLDQMHHVSSIKVDFSRIFYDNAYDKYEEYYYTEYLELLEFSEENENIEKTPPSSEELEVNIIDNEEEQKHSIKSDNEELSSFDGGEEQDYKSESTEPAKQLVNEFDEDTFWNEKKHESIQHFAQENNLNNKGIKELIENYLFTEKDPLRDEVVAIMNEKPKLHERQGVTQELKRKIIELADNLRNEK